MCVRNRTPSCGTALARSAPFPPESEGPGFERRERIFWNGNLVYSNPIEFQGDRSLRPAHDNALHGLRETHPMYIPPLTWRVSPVM